MTRPVTAAGARRRGRAGSAKSASKGASKGEAQAQPSAPGAPAPPPLQRPPFTLKDVRAAIPKHCFERSTWRSLGHLAVDLALVLGLGYAASFIASAGAVGPVPGACVRGLLWLVYAYTCGVCATGVWVLAHECGHGAFSASKGVCDAVGMVLHSALLVPYHSWKISHAHHHANTCSVEDDEVFVPPSRSDVAHVFDSPLANTLFIVNMLLLGWPAYLIGNVAGPKKYADKAKSHFTPSAALFTEKQRPSIVTSDVGVAVTLGLLAYSASVFGVGTVACFYGLPYLMVNAHLVLITYLQHTDTYIPHYRAAEFDWLRGALSTVDRSFGWLVDDRLHHISDTHVAHHIFHYMPFYHAQEATEALREVLGPYYLKDERSILPSLYSSWHKCKFVEDEGAYLHFKSAEDF